MAPLCHKCAPVWRPWKEKQILKYSKINNVLLLVKRQGLRAGRYPTSYQIAWTMQFFCNSSTVSLFLCQVRTAQPSQTQSRLQFSTCCCAVWKWFVVLQVYSLMPDDGPETKTKGSSKNRNAMWKTYYWLKILRASKMKTIYQFQDYCQYSSWVRSLSAS